MLADFRKVLAILTAAERRNAGWMLALMVVMASAETLGVVSVMPFMSVLGRPDVIHENVLLQTAYTRLGFNSSRDFMVALGVASIATVLASSLFKAVALHLVNRFVNRLRHSISSRLLSRYLHQPYEFFLTHNTSQLSGTVLSEVDQLVTSLIQPLSQLFSQGPVVLAMLGLMFWYDALAAIVITAAATLLYGSIYSVARRRLARIGKERQIANGDRFRSCNEVLEGIKDVKISHAEGAYQAKFDRASRNLSRYVATGETMSQTPLYLVEAVGYAGLILIALILMLRRNDIAHVLPALGLYGFAAYRMLPAAQIMYRGFAKLKFSSAALDAIHRDLALTHDVQIASSEALVPHREIRLTNISYAYPSRPEKPVLDRFNLCIPAGTTVGIAGRTGAGKSTLMDIMLGLLKAQEGMFSVDGVMLDAKNIPAWQAAIGYVPQHIYLSDASVAENIAFGVARMDIDVASVERAARTAQIHDFVANELEYGYDTPVGNRGIRLSGGQRQRIGIARALYRDPPVLLMDEATSALDGETERALTDAIARLSGEKTIIVIAHKEESLKQCDIVVHLGEAELAPSSAPASDKRTD